MKCRKKKKKKRLNVTCYWIQLLFLWFWTSPSLPLAIWIESFFLCIFFQNIIIKDLYSAYMFFVFFISYSLKEYILQSGLNLLKFWKQKFLSIETSSSLDKWLYISWPILQRIWFSYRNKWKVHHPLFLTAVRI